MKSAENTYEIHFTLSGLLTTFREDIVAKDLPTHDQIRKIINQRVIEYGMGKRTVDQIFFVQQRG